MKRIVNILIALALTVVMLPLFAQATLAETASLSDGHTLTIPDEFSQVSEIAPNAVLYATPNEDQGIMIMEINKIKYMPTKAFADTFFDEFAKKYPGLEIINKRQMTMNGNSFYVIDSKQPNKNTFTKKQRMISAFFESNDKLIMINYFGFDTYIPSNIYKVLSSYK